ncbi:hypothetical protein TNCV_1817181 [Trichonephila clavipes]|nr:hypothetical protein TNCV_1817181 [Trichonephila clavipes]
MSCSPDLALKRKQVWHLDKSLPTTPLPEGIQNFCRMQHKSTNQLMESVKNPDLANVAQTTTVYELLAWKLQYLMKHNRQDFLDSSHDARMLQKSFFEFLRYDWQQRFSICWEMILANPKQFGSLRKEMTYRFELLFSEILTQQRKVQKEAELPKVRAWARLSILQELLLS